MVQYSSHHRKGVAWQIWLFNHWKRGFTDFRVQTWHMKQMSLVKPHRLTGFRMSGSLTDLTGSEMICASPLKLYASVTAISFDLWFVTCLKDIFPLKIQSFHSFTYMIFWMNMLSLGRCSLKTFRLSAIGVSPPCTFTQKKNLYWPFHCVKESIDQLDIQLMYDITTNLAARSWTIRIFN